MPHALVPLARKLGAFVDLSPDEHRLLESLGRRRQTLERRTELIAEGERSRESHYLIDGWAYCYKHLPDGRRQIINFAVPGDFLGLRSAVFHTTDHSVATVTRVTISSFDSGQLLALLGASPRLGVALLWALSCEEAIVVEHLVNVGRRNARERVAHLVIELGKRLQLAGLAGEGEFPCPLTQEDMADALGLTAIHVNRVLRELREQGLVSFERGRVVVHDLSGLMAVAGFKPEYLDPWQRSIR